MLVKAVFKGSYTLSGVLPDGSKFTSACFYGPDGQALIYHSLYKNRGSLIGGLDISPGRDAPLDNNLEGELDWLKPAPLTLTSKGQLYRAGFSAELSAKGGTYTPTAKGQIVMGLPPTPTGVANALMRFEGAGLPASIRQVLRFASTGATSVISPNPNAVKIKFSATTGLITGTLTTATVPKRAATFKALIVPEANIPEPPNVQENNVMLAPVREQVGYGYFLLPQVPVAPQTKATSPILSGQVILTPNVD